MPRIFLSHSSLDSDAAKTLTDWLRAQGFESLFLDIDKTHGIPPGEDWERKLYSEIQRSTAVLLLLTKNWFESKWCFVEFTQARALGKSVLPVVVAPSGDQFIGDNLQKIFLTHDRENGFTRLLDRLRDISLIGPEGFEHAAGRPPYPGMMSFEEDDAAVFFGRGPETRETLEQLERMRRTGQARVLQIHGESGSGKSSLLKAGILPQLKRRTKDWLPLPVFRPGRKPLRELEKALCAACSQPDQTADPVDIELIRAFLSNPTTTSADTLITRLCALNAASARPDASLLISIDQFEEIETISTPEQREGFLNALNVLLGRDLNTSLIMTLRASDLPLVERMLDAPTMSRALGPFPFDRLPEIVRKPAEAVRIQVEDTLVASIQRDATSADALPLVAFLLRRLYDRHGSDYLLTRAEYDLLGDSRSNLNPLETCIRDAADDAIQRCNPSDAERRALREAFVPGLVRLSDAGEGHTRRPLSANDIPRDALRLIDALVDERLLVRRDDGSIEVAHEALFRVWTPLRTWLEEEREFLLGFNRLDAALADWQAAPDEDKQKAELKGLLLSKSESWMSEHPQRFSAEHVLFIEASLKSQRAATRRRSVLRVVTLAASLLAATILGVLALYADEQQTIAEQQRDAAVTEREKAQAAERVAEQAAEAELLQREQAEEARSKAEQATAAAESALYTQSVTMARTLYQLEDYNRARSYHDAAPAHLRNWEWGSVEALLNRSVTVLSGHDALVLSASFSPDGMRIVTASSDETARIWDAATGAEVALLSGHAAPVWSASFSPDDARVVTASIDNTARVWDAATGAAVAVLSGHDGDVLSASFSPDGSRIVTASSDETARVWDAATGAAVAVLSGHDGDVRSASFSPDSTRIVTTSWDETARIWDAATGAEVALLLGHAGAVWSASFSPDGARVVTASIDNTARVWDAATGAAVAVLSGHDGDVRSASFSPDGSRIVTASSDETARVWDAAAGAAVAVISRHTAPIWSASFSPDGSRIVTASSDETARIWDAATGAPVTVLLGHTAAVWSASFSPDGARVVTTSFDNTARVWDAATGASIAVSGRAVSTEVSASFSPDATRVVTASRDDASSAWSWAETGRVWDAATGAAVAVLSGHTNILDSASFSPDGTRILTASWDTTARVWDAETGAVVAVLSTHTMPVLSASFSPDGSRIVTASSDETARVWDAATGAAVAVLSGHDGDVRSASFSPDGTRILTASRNTARIWDSIPIRIRFAERLANERGEDGSAIVQAWLDAVKQGTQDDFVVPLN